MRVSGGLLCLICKYLIYSYSKNKKKEAVFTPPRRPRRYPSGEGYFAVSSAFYLLRFVKGRQALRPAGRSLLILYYYTFDKSNLIYYEI